MISECLTSVREFIWNLWCVFCTGDNLHTHNREHGGPLFLERGSVGVLHIAGSHCCCRCSRFLDKVSGSRRRRRRRRCDGGLSGGSVETWVTVFGGSGGVS